MANKYLDDVGLAYFWDKIKVYFQEKLVSGTNIKTINNQSLLGSGNIPISGGGGSVLDFYPVGSYYETSDSSFDPNVSWGGTWVKETSGQVHVSSGSGYAVSGAMSNTSDGGSEYIQEHSHGFTNPTIDTSSGSHTHTVAVRYRTGTLASGSAQSQPYANASNTSNNIAYTPSGGGTHGHSYSANGSVNAVSGVTAGQGGNMMPYIVVNRWHRTA